MTRWFFASRAWHESLLPSRPCSLRRTRLALLSVLGMTLLSSGGQRLPAASSFSQEPPAVQTSEPGVPGTRLLNQKTSAGHLDLRQCGGRPASCHSTNNSHTPTCLCVKPHDWVTHQLVGALGMWLHAHKPVGLP